ncbi:Tyrosinase ustQ [Colletotrichum trifolii]|uniref:Tyrosinase ustQ n=1 Tax=Colletotrichum trifolii TaxID=5466 RepID=A0A4R8QMY8_COLTR|nr:Tyrosinase ustQ [Colletotrichum trifolii]
MRSVSLIGKVAIFLASARSVIGAPVAQTDPVTAPPPPPPAKEPAQRVEWRNLTTEVQASYITSVKCLQTLPSKVGLQTSRYHDFPALHATLQQEIHFVAQFLPWHRYFVHVYEKTLRDECNYTGAFPYWDWTLDYLDITKSPVFSADNATGFGGNGNQTEPNSNAELTQCVTDGAFAGFELQYFDLTARPHCINRRFNDGPSGDMGKYIQELYTPDIISGIIRNATDFSQFSTSLENAPHGAIHTAIGGDFTVTSAPNDALFFLHHAQVDRVWWMWQQADPDRLKEYSGLQKFQNGTDNDDPASLSDPLRMLGLAEDVSVESVMSTAGGLLSYTYV